MRTALLRRQSLTCTRSCDERRSHSAVAIPSRIRRDQPSSDDASGSLKVPVQTTSLDIQAPPLRLRVFFGHQSVGTDILAGAEALLRGLVSAPAIVRTRSPASIEGPLIAHDLIGNNHDPASKLDDFAAALSGIEHCVDFVFLKFCYVDVTTMEQAHATFDLYRQRLRQLQSSHPALTFGHVTVPLRTAPAGLLYRMRAMLQGPHPEHVRNQARHWFNCQLLAEYGDSGLVFDLAAVESERADGSRVIHEVRGAPAPALHAAYSRDGGHLNETGKLRVARAFLDFLQAAQTRLPLQPC